MQAVNDVIDAILLTPELGRWTFELREEFLKQKGELFAETRPNNPLASTDTEELDDAKLLLRLEAESRAALGRVYQVDNETPLDSVDLPSGCELGLKREDLSIARGSSSIRRTCASTALRSYRSPASAAFINSRSGGPPHRI